MVDFGGWELPVQYSGLAQEHEACRTAAGLFDVSHMGEVLVEGKDATAYLEFLCTNEVSKLAVGQALYTVMCRDSGGVVDDLLVYRREPGGQGERYLLVINASNTDKDVQWILEVADRFKAGHPGALVKIDHVSAKYSQIALQGPLAEKILGPLCDLDLSRISTYRFGEGTLLGEIPAIIARTGYTGEDGFELYMDWNQAPRVWNALADAGTPMGLKPCGLGARDTLRLEMKYALYGHEITEDTNPLEAGLGWVVKLNKPSEFVGKESLQEIKEAGTARALVGVKVVGRGIPRQGYTLHTTAEGAPTGIITSGTHSPSLKEPIGIAYVPKTHSTVGSKLWMDVRGQKVEIAVTETPFYKNQRSKA